jgi:hypothetical protein
VNQAIRLAALVVLGLPGMFADVLAGVPSPVAEVPPFVYVVGFVVTSPTPEPDPFGEQTITVTDESGTPAAGASVVIDFSPCCDIALCSAGGGHDCATRTVTGSTDIHGEYRFTVFGAGRDPGTAVPPCQKEGCGEKGVIVYANIGSGYVEVGRMTAVLLDQNGAAGGSNGTSGADVSALIGLFGSVAAGSPYRGRGDIDANGSITGGDVATLIYHFGRLQWISGFGCTSSFCVQADCSPPFYGPGVCHP